STRTTTRPGAPKILISRRAMAVLAIVALMFVGWGLAGRIHASEPAWTPSWRTVRSDVGRFSVELPGEPREQTDANKDAGVEAALHTMSASIGDAAVFGVGWIDLPAAIS